MTTPNRPQQYRLSWPLDPSQVEGMDSMFETLFKRLRAISASAIGIGPQGVQGIPGCDGADGDDAFCGPYGPRLDNFTLGSVIFAGPSGRLAQDNAKFFWDDTNFRLGIGTTSPLADISVTNPSNAAGAFVELRLTSNAQSLYFDVLAAGSGLYGAGHAEISSSAPLDILSPSSINFYGNTYDATHLFMALSSAGVLTFSNGGYPNPTTEAIGETTGKTGALFVRPATDIAAIVIETFNESAADRAISVKRSGVENFYVDQNGGLFVSGSGNITSLVDASTDLGTSSKRFRDAWLSRDLHIAGTALVAGASGSAYLHIGAGTAAASTAPIKFTSGTNLASAEAGAVEWDGTNLFVTQTSGPTRKTIAYSTDFPLIAASVLEKSETGTDANVLTYTANASTDEALHVDVMTDISALTGTSVVVTVTWKDSNNATATATATLSGVSDGTINVPIVAFKNTNVVVSTVFTGVSTAYKISAIITRNK